MLINFSNTSFFQPSHTIAATVEKSLNQRLSYRSIATFTPNPSICVTHALNAFISPVNWNNISEYTVVRQIIFVRNVEKGSRFPCNLERHIRTVHCNYKEFKCSECHETFGKKETLLAHQQIHTGVAPFQCPACGKGFKYEHNIKRHTCKPAENPSLNCEVCGQEFNNMKSLKQHFLKHKESQYCCHLCGKSFTWRSGLSNHLKSCYR